MKRDDAPGPSLPPQSISLDVLREKYLKPGESSVEDLFRRVGRALASVEREDLRDVWEARFVRNLQSGAIGAGRIMSAAGTGLQATLINCFVQPVGDCIQGVDDEGYPGIYEALREAAETMRRGGGVGYDFSRIRPRGAEVRATASIASGPCSYIDVFDHSCATVESAGARRGAQMGVLRIDHPDVLEFITAKRKPGRWSNFNVSVAVTDAFMHALEAGQDWPLVHRARPGPGLVESGARQRDDGMWIYRSLPARELWDTVMKSAYDFAEPGILFPDTINRENNLRYCEKIAATNPCVTADTWVHTTEGPRQVAELVGRRFTAVVDGKAYPVLSEGFFPTGHKPVLALRTREGFGLRLTADHKVRRALRTSRFLVESEWVEAAQLRAGDEIVLHDHRRLAGWEGEGSEAEGYLLGLLVGNGTLDSEQAAISLQAPELRCLANGGTSGAGLGATAVMLAAQAAVAALPQRGACAGFERLTGGRGHARMRSAAVSHLAHAVGMQPGQPIITPAMERRSSDFVVGLLRGLFDADGAVQGPHDKNVSVRLSRADEAQLHAVQRMLARLGVASHIDTEGGTASRKGTSRPLPNGHGELTVCPGKPQHGLVIEGDNLHEFASRIGFEDEGKATLLDQALAINRRTLNRERFTAVVASIDPDGSADVFDVTVADVHAFDANGLVVHNCGEQPLPPYGCCDLGPIILTRFVQNPFNFGGAARFDFQGFAEAVAVQVRALDNVLDLTFWPLEQQRAEAQAKRRIGVGFTGMGNTLTMLGLRYDEPAGREVAVRIARRMRDAAYEASVELAREKGAFPEFKADGYLQPGTFASRLDESLQAAIRVHGIRNSHLLSIAPTGTVSLAFADNASNGIEPAFSWMYRRKKREAAGGTSEYQVEDHAWRVYRSLGGDVEQLPPSFVSALEMSAESHIAMMQAVQPFVDTAISKTVNIPADYPYDDFKSLYSRAWAAGLKGLATYRPNTIVGSVLEAGTAAPVAVGSSAPAPVDPMRAVIASRPKGALHAVAEKIEYWTQQGRQNLYLIVSFLPLPDGQERAIEFFMPVGQSGESQQWISASMRLLSLAARGGFLERALADMRKVAWDRGPVRLGTYEKADGTHVPLWHDSEVAAIAYAVQNIIARRNRETGTTPMPEPEASSTPGAAPPMAGAKCPECGAYAMIRKDGCDWCSHCGHVGSCG